MSISEATKVASKMISGQLADRDSQLRTDISKIRNEMAGRGVLQSGMTFSRIHSLCKTEIRNRARIVWQILFRALNTVKVHYSEELATALKKEVEKYFPKNLPKFNPILKEAAQLSNYKGKLPDLSNDRARALAEVYGEIDLYVLALHSADEEEEKSGAQQNIYKFYSPVGAVQTGQNAIANVVQTIDSQDREILLQALDTIKQSLAVSEELASYPKEEIIDLVEEAKTEIKKDKPNGLRLRSIITTVATAIQTVSILQKAYQALKVAVLPLGIQLP
jgi:hypothetical protein